MVKPPPPLLVPPPEAREANGIGNKLPETSRYPVLVSGQVSFTTAAAIRDVEQVPQNVYRIQVDLKPRTRDKTFKDAPWTLVARHFLSTIQLQDEKAIIIRKKENTVVNKITSPEELPENPEIFERDYAYDVQLKNNRLVSFKILIATTKTYSKTFKEGPMYRKLTANEWFVKYIRLESQGTVAEIGNLLYAHNRFVNQADLITEIRQLIHPTLCNEIDITVTKANEYYYEKDKKVRVYTRWPTVICPIDIASQLSQVIMEKWELLESDEKFKNFNLRNIKFVPRNKTLVPFSARIETIGKQNEFLRNYQDVTVIRNCTDVSAEFTVTQKMADLFGLKERRGHVISLRTFLRSWEDHTTGRPAIVAINRTNNVHEYSLLTGRENKTMIHEEIIKLVEELKGQSNFKQLEVGGTKGMMTRTHHSEKVKNYATQWLKSERQFDQKPPTKVKNGETNKSEEEDINAWQTPPTINRKMTKAAKQSIIVNYNDKDLIQTYEDVVSKQKIVYDDRRVTQEHTTAIPNYGNKKMRNKNEERSDDTNSTTQLSTLTNSTYRERKLTTAQQVQEIISSKNFKDMLSQIVAPQVSNLIEPTVKKINQIETQVGELHDHVQNNHHWQEQQTTRQEKIQTDVNDMTTSMQQVQESMNMMMQMYMEREAPSGVKRPAPKEITMMEARPSPQRRQRKQSSNKNDTLITQESVKETNYDSDSDMAHKPNQSDETFLPRDKNDMSEEEGES